MLQSGWGVVGCRGGTRHSGCGFQSGICWGINTLITEDACLSLGIEDEHIFHSECSRSLGVEDEHICHSECISQSLDVEDEHICHSECVSLSINAEDEHIIMSQRVCKSV